MGRSSAVVISLVVFLSFCAVSMPGPARAQAITIKVANWFPVSHQQDITLRAYAKELETRAGGKLKVKYYAAQTLVPTAQSYDAVVKGISDVGNHVLGYTMGRFPFTQILDFPLGYPAGAEATKIANEFYERFRPKEFNDVKVLFFHAQPGGFLHTKARLVTTMEDLRGLKLRCYGSNARFVGLIGAAPVAMPMSEVYDALSKGVVDGLMSSYEALHGWKTGEHVNFTTENRDTAYSAVFIVMMNKRKFASLPPDMQALVDQMSREYVEKYGKMWADLNLVAKSWLINRGTKLTVLSKAEEARWYEKGTKPLINAYTKEMKAKGLPGEEAVQFVQEALKRYKK
jgi:TRAP-type C4-dicarboxylate transport system substrate-binding protein